VKKASFKSFKHFKNILNPEQEDREENENVTYYTAQPLIVEPNREELEDIIATLKNNKTRGEDNINSGNT